MGMQRVSYWVQNIFPNGYNFPNYLSNFISSVDKQFTIKSERFSQCKTKDDMADVMYDLMELKFPIHLRCIDCLNPSINSYEETSSFLKRMIVSFTEAKMSQAHWENILLHLLLKHLPDNEVFRKQREWISNYMSELSSQGATSRADLRKAERHIQRIEADLSQNNKPTFQALQNWNRRTVHQEKSDVRCNICHQKGHSEKQCHSPCWICKEPGHRNMDCPKREDRGRSKSRGRGRNESNSRQRGQSKRRRNSPYAKKKKQKTKNKKQKTKNKKQKTKNK